jgi:hypothetical protein
LDRRIEAFDDEFAALAKTDDIARRLVSIPGIGVLNATALTAAIGTGPHSLVAATSAGPWCPRGPAQTIDEPDAVGQWLQGLMPHAHKNTVDVALATSCAGSCGQCYATAGPTMLPP